MRFKLAYSGRSKLGVVGLRGLKLNPALLSYLTSTRPARPARRRGRRRERRVSKRLHVETVDRLVAEYAAGTPAAELGRRYGIAKSSVLGLLRQAGTPVRHPRLSAREEAQLVELYEAGLPPKRHCPAARPQPQCSVALSAAAGAGVIHYPPPGAASRGPAP
jgi:hypothetical protein